MMMRKTELMDLSVECCKQQSWWRLA